MLRTLAMERAMGVAEMERSPRAFLFAPNIDLTWTAPSFPPASAEESLVPLKDLANNARPAFFRYVYLPIWKFAWRDQDKLNLMTFWQAEIDRARRQFRQPNWAANRQSERKFPFGDEDSSNGLADRLRYQYDRARYLCSWYLIPAIGRASTRAVECEAVQALCRVAIALRRYQSAQGSHPDSLQQLVPEFLSAVPLDPFDGQPLRYRRNKNESFTLYSVGENGRDDGGDPSTEKSVMKPTLMKGRDIVWPRAATEKEIEKFIAPSIERPPPPRRAPN